MFNLSALNINEAEFQLVYDELGLQLFKKDEPKLGAIRVDFVTGAVAHRRKFGGGKGQAIAKAVGLNKGAVPTVLDATAGLGRDAFVLASMGCKVVLHERNPVVAALLYDGLQRAYQDAEIGEWVQSTMRLEFGSSHDLLEQAGWRPDIVYLDPMFPHREKSAQVKKEMRVFQDLVGNDLDADALLPFALQLATKRVVVKRPDYAGFLNDKTPSMQIKTKKNRFDVYVNSAMK
ncbi:MULTISPECIES: class I SAM-dependent methyltransferase [unclassified Pseudoalteromonas]|uniref:class I SAM-dependent methyltransferase n=1 Tax=Pseudoalteromonas sp. Of5H-6 TaxID=3136664 RepID=UPI001F48FA54|nr:MULTISPECIES: class I SAM-dependent methyltransferase [unclassified Pseudoalteromonas]MCF2825720.1 class I SAM-dependent methyltransferase [Pseudoalteromonas sp. OF5H-5]MCF2832134.1 class I SAM-dependent methyltransferase [Pseudoalteromonas sp. DL2-H6]MCF2923720.1 class I SAM-dependent methyltransferase [Pseudoalteromonas sp. DL2-H1]